MFGPPRLETSQLGKDKRCIKVHVETITTIAGLRSSINKKSPASTEDERMARAFRHELPVQLVTPVIVPCLDALIVRQQVTGNDVFHNFSSIDTYPFTSILDNVHYQYVSHLRSDSSLTLLDFVP